MLPIAPLMLEHRLIERMINAMKSHIGRIAETGMMERHFIDLYVDFVRTYADRCHHGKEEDILFRLLGEKDISENDRRIMRELTEDHVRAREMTNRLAEAGDRYASDGPSALEEVRLAMEALVSFYPAHIEKEDRHFFIPSMGYFTPHEQDDIFESFAEFDRKVIHERYRSVVEEAEGHEDVHGRLQGGVRT